MDGIAIIKSCPFCGSSEVVGPTDAWPHMINCCGCGAGVKGFKFGDEGKREATEKWNRREGEQLPRVLTLEEVQEIGRSHIGTCADYDRTFVWFEEKGLKPYPARIEYYFHPEWGDDEDDDRIHVACFGSDGNESFFSRYYGMYWRCWTKKPTNEQMEAQAW